LRVLTQRLRLFEQAGIMERDHQPMISPQVSYSLTAHGQELSQILDDLAVIAKRWEAEDKAVRRTWSYSS